MRDGLLIAVAGAIATSIVAAILSPSSLGAIRDLVSGDGGKGSSASTLGSAAEKTPASKTRFTYRAATSSDGSLTLRLPSDWGAREAGWNLVFVRTPQGAARHGLAYPGTAMQAGIGTGLNIEAGAWMDSESYWLGASAEAATNLGLPGRSSQELRGYLAQLARAIPYGAANGCDLADEGELDVEGYLVYHRRWTGCAGFASQSLWDVYGVSRSGDVMMSAILVTKTLTDIQARELLTTWTVAPEHLPTGPALRREDVGQYPLPPWVAHARVGASR